MIFEPSVLSNITLSSLVTHVQLSRCLRHDVNTFATISASVASRCILFLCVTESCGLATDDVASSSTGRFVDWLERQCSDDLPGYCLENIYLKYIPKIFQKFNSEFLKFKNLLMYIVLVRLELKEEELLIT